MSTPTPLETRLSRVKTPGEPVVVFDRVFLAFGDNVILKDVSFELRAGYSKIFLGASGAGKSTILKLILGLLKPQAGRIWVNGVRIDELSENDMMKVLEDVGMVFQEGALFDSLTVRENVGYKLYEESDMPLDQVHRRVEEVLGWVELEQHIDKMPSQLSGGQRRRVAIARAMTFQPRILLYEARPDRVRDAARGPRPFRGHRRRTARHHRSVPEAFPELTHASHTIPRLVPAEDRHPRRGRHGPCRDAHLRGRR